MKYSQAEPPLPTIRRWIDLNRSFPGNSTLRKLEYEKLCTTEITGQVLDVGGGKKSKYQHELPAGIEYFSVNIDPNMEPTWLIEPGEPFPVQDATFDVCMPHIPDSAYASIMFRNCGGRYTGWRGQRICSVAIGHFIRARK